MSQDYTYQVARIRALEVGLLTDSDIDSLIVAKDAEGAFRMLLEKGWGDGDEHDYDDMLTREQEKIWEVVSDLRVDMKSFDVLRYPKLYHNLKAAVKEASTQESKDNIYYGDMGEASDSIISKVKQGEFSELPDNMRKAAEEAYDVLSHTGDGQLSDVIIDKALMDAIMEAGRKAEKSGDKVIADYAEQVVATSDIRFAIRSARTGKSKDFMERGIAECATLNKDELIRSALSGEEEIEEYLMTTDYKDGAAKLSESPSAFEKWLDDSVMEKLRAQKFETFTIGPVMAYILARENEIKTCRIVLTGKENGLTEEEIKERVRSMYA